MYGWSCTSELGIDESYGIALKILRPNPTERVSEGTSIILLL